MRLSSQSESSSNIAFKPSQIVCLEHTDQRLFSEVIQTVEATQICWVRPLLLIQSTSCFSVGIEEETSRLYDLRQGADLLLPATLFRVAFDTEVIPLLTMLNNLDELDSNHSKHHSKLNQLIQQVCLAQKA
ncbi:MAG: hypothetical protein NW224_28965 [Leptolyngbyaceae cyanobacterium bins.302]|nr:hypothetical protein [Leptolyngbyaceae cyanobacterium bins.302]